MPECTEELIALMQKHFKYLFTTYGFKVIHAESYRGGEYCFVVLESSACRVKMDYQLGYINLFFGTLSAPLDLEDEGWYYLRNVLDFLREKPAELTEILAEDKALWSLSPSGRLAYWSAKLKPVCGEVINIFREESIEQRQRLDKYLQWSLGEMRRQLDEK